MMQQQICQPEQMNNQQSQQVMLCPVRLVYETQILVQPGEQIQPNQTLFINPQNPPPWIQNRAQNQVVYMQQLPSNMVQMPQTIDQNQLYLPNYYPQMVTQMDQLRQMPNVLGQNIMGVPPNVAPNIGQNIGQTVTNVNMNVQQNVMQVPNVIQNVRPQNVGANVGNERYARNVVQTNLPIPNQNVNVNQPVQERQAQMNQNLVNMQKVVDLQGVRQNMRQPQVTVSPMQAKFGPNVGDVRPIATRPQVNMNLVNLQPNTLAKKVPLPNKTGNQIVQNQTRHYNQTYYRPIQPRPMSVVPMAQNQYLPMQSVNLMPRPQNQPVTEISRKRKSESPDETVKKIPNTGVANFNQQTITAHNIASQVNAVHTDVGVNTMNNPRDIKLVKPVEMASTGTQANIVKAKPQIDIPKGMEITAIPSNVGKDNVSMQTDDKLVRNTVFTQARGLIRTETQVIQPDVIINIHKIENVAHKAVVKENSVPETVNEVPKNVNDKFNDVTSETNTPSAKEVIKTKVNENDVKMNEPKSIPSESERKEVFNKPLDKIKEVPKASKLENKTESKVEVKEKSPVKTEVKEVKEMSKKFTVTAISDFKGNEIQIADGSVRKEDTDSYILTHVLDGYVIQESNTAFPIRKPLKEKTIYSNTELGTEQKKEETYKHRTEDGKVIKDNSKILSISDLKLAEDDQVTEDTSQEKHEDHPFANLKPATVKSWTVDELATHLSKYEWAETISVLSEHEIDGESLFLVSKPQLVQIGVSEEHADVICDFIKK